MPPDDNRNQNPTLKVTMAKGVVARGRTIMVPNLNKRVLAYNHPETGKAMMRHEMLSYGEGAEVELAEDEIVSLRERGFLTDPSKVVQPMAEGSHVKEIGSNQQVRAA